MTVSATTSPGSAQRKGANMVEGEFAFTDADFRKISAMVHGDAGIHLPEERLDELAALIADLVADRTRREAMGQQMRSLARPDAAERLAELVLDLAARGEAAA